MSKGLNPKPYLNPKAEIVMRVSEINRLNELVERDEAMPIVEEEKEDFAGEQFASYFCPACRKRLMGNLTYEKDINFCKYCGQRIDVENIAL